MDATGYITRHQQSSSGYMAADTPGERIRAARERAGLSLADMSADLKICIPYLEAIEAMDAAHLPERAYTMGFVRCCADRLDLPVQEIVEGFGETCFGATRQTTNLYTGPESWWPDFQMPRGFGAAFAIAGILALIAWYGAGVQSAPRAVPPVPEALQSWAESDQLSPIPAMQDTQMAQANIQTPSH